MTVAPLIANGVLITGISGAEFGIRGFIDGWDPETGKHLWRRYTIPARGEKGNETWPQDNDAWKTGGGSSWITGSYDPELDLTYWGTGNPAPWASQTRPGDNLYTASVLAMRPKTGEIVWHYQFDAERPIRLRRQLGNDPRRSQRRRRQAQGADAAQPQRLPLCDRPHQRPADLGQAVREGELGEPRRHEDRPPGRDRDRQETARRRAGRAVADAARRQELAACRVQSRDRPALCQHHAFGAVVQASRRPDPYVVGPALSSSWKICRPSSPTASRSAMSMRSSR